MIRTGGIHINQQRVTDPKYVLVPGEHILRNNMTLIKKGEQLRHILTPRHILRSNMTLIKKGEALRHILRNNMTLRVSP